MKIKQYFRNELRVLMRTPKDTYNEFKDLLREVKIMHRYIKRRFQRVQRIEYYVRFE